MRMAWQVVLLLALTTALMLTAGAGWAAAEGAPAPPPGCQFQNGITSCTMTTTTSELAPLQFGQGTVGPTTDGSGAALLCAQQGASFYRLATLFVAVQLTTTTTTTTSHRGAPDSNGMALPTQTTTSTVASIFAGQVECF